MPASEPLHARLIGALFVERGLVSESQIRVALEIQRETGQQLGQVLVERFGVSRKELASVVAEQWAKLGGTSGPEDHASWRRLGDIFVERGFVSAEELEHALARQRQTGERLGEALVAQGVISKFELAGALAEQMAALGDPDAEGTQPEQPEATVHHLPTRMPDPAEIPFGAVVDVEPEPEVTAAEDEPAVPEDVEKLAPAPEEAADEFGVGSPEPEAAEIMQAVFDVGEPIAAEEPSAAEEPERFEPLEAIAIDDVGHVSLLAAGAEPAELAAPEEAASSELFDDLRHVIAAEAVAEDPRHEVLPSVECLAFAPTTEGYRLVLLDTVPEPGETLALPDVGERVVLRVGRSPLPGDTRMCAYVEEPVTPAPVVALAY